MPNLMNVSVVRSPQVQLAAAAGATGWTLEPARRIDPDSTTVVPSPADYLLPAELRAKLFPQDAQDAWSAFVVPHVGPSPVPVDIVIPGRAQRRPPTLQFDDLYSTLYYQCLNRNADGIEKTASTFLRESPIAALDQFDSITLTYFRFFNQHGCNATIAELRELFSAIEQFDPLFYLRNAFRLADWLKCEILAAHVLGILGSQKYSLIQVLRALLTFSAMAPYFLPRRPDTYLGQPLKLFCALWNMPCYLPAWTFEIDPCAWSKSATDISNNPLKSKLAALDAYTKKVATKQAVVAVGSIAGAPKNLLADIPECNPQAAADPDCDCQPQNVLCLPPDPCCAEINYYVTDLLVLREETYCYKPSDLAYIENVSPGESRSRKHALTKSIEQFTEEETKVSKTEERDLQVTDRFDLKVEIEKNISAKLDVTAEVTGTGYKVTTAAGLSMETAQKEARETFRETVEKAVSTLQVDTRKTQSLKIRTENVETNEHDFENKTTLPFVSKYFWVTQVKKGQVFSHGLHGTVELLIPSPAMLYEHLETLKSERGFGLKKPKHPCLDPTKIKPEDYVGMLVKYNILDLPPPPPKPAPQPVGVRVSQFIGKDGSGQFHIPPILVDIPDGSVATSMRFDGDVAMSHTGPGDFDNIVFSYGGDAIFRQRNPGPGETEFKGTANVAVAADTQATVSGTNLESFTFNVIVMTEKKVDYTEWQFAVFKAVMQKYQTDLQKYEDALAEYNRQKEENKLGRDPFAAKEIMAAEIKRAAIYMMCDEFERDGIMNMRSEPCGYPEINRRAADDKAKGWYFWDRAFDWDLMSFRFYDYFRNPVCSWPDKFDPADPNFLFNAFRRAGYARVQIPVSAGMDEDVLYYTKTRRKWGPGGQLPKNPADHRWISVIEEIKHSYKCYQDDREGDIVPIANEIDPSKGTREVLLKGTDLYWNVFTSSPDNHAIDLDKEREIYIDGIGYKIINISRSPTSRPYDPTGETHMTWLILLDRVFEGKADGIYKHAIGAKYVGAPFFFELPTNLVWIGDYDNKCLPSYPLKACIS